ncbi:MAG: sigma-54 dependent transcriptional regulator [Vicinamibacteraceae bacterium]|nr:sigma-54 dependent transcriptional regulator [Vicinamibacteraceae bacterium]
MSAVLLVDDEPKILRGLERALRDDGHEVVATSNPHEARRLLGRRFFDVLVADNLMPEVTGLELVRELSAGGSDRPQTILMTAYASIESAIEAMRLGAFDYLQKPFEIDELLVVVRRAIEHGQLRSQHRYLLSERDEEFAHYGFVGRSPRVLALLREVDLVAAAKSTVLITGETGTGKELLARAIHHRSAQSGMPLVKVNCAAIPETLLESELFGHVRGAFTGALANKKGKFALAHGSTIFLDEVATLTLPLQAKLLRVLQEREFEPLGDERSQRVDVRVVAATNRPLRQLVAEGRFLDDLFYRLNVIPLSIPPLRERKEDIPLLVEHFVRKHAARIGRQIEGVADGVLEALMGHDWPGNVRELENTIERAVVLSTGPTIGPAIVPALSAGAAPAPHALPGVALRENIEWAERETVRRALALAGGVKKDAAERMGISQRALSYYLAKHHIE